MLARSAPLLAGLLLVGGDARAAATFAGEATIGPGWRVAFGQTDRAPGFEALTGGVEALAGVGFGAVGVVGGARFRGGSSNGAAYLELDGELALQIYLGERARARVGAEAGWAHLDGSPAVDAPLVGGFAALSLDLLSFAAGRAAL
ncbi:MAG TPA: hypothetical protein VE987_15295, partial [Polyangiaceae bacterium]|nr:hypothetical protein [Polyangiaceae bacterium]